MHNLQTWVELSQERIGAFKCATLEEFSISKFRSCILHDMFGFERRQYTGDSMQNRLSVNCFLPVSLFIKNHYLHA